MARQAAKLILALQAEARAHQNVVNIGDELKTIQNAGQEPDEDEMRRLRQACEALVAAGRAVEAAVYSELLISRGRKAA